MNSIIYVLLTYRSKLDDINRKLRVFKDQHVLLVDNNEYKTFKPKYKLNINQQVIYTGRNIGYTGGINNGLREAIMQNFSWIIVMNDDIEIDFNIINNIKHRIIGLNPCIAGPHTGKIDKKRWTSIYKYDLLGDIDYISGSLVAIHKNIIRSIGLFFEPYFIYYEDVEYCLKAKKNGFELIQLNDIKIHHEDSATMGKNSFLKQYYLARNHLLFVKRNAPLRVKLYEMLRMPKTLWEHYQRKEYGALEGIKDFALGKFGKKEGTL